MKDSDYHKLYEFVTVGGGLMPSNEKAREFIDSNNRGKIVSLKEVTERDLQFHRCYFSLLNYIYSYLPDKFKKAIPENKFYIWLKHLKQEYEIVFTFADGSKMVEYDSISFGRMSENEFKTYVKSQLPYIYENVIGAFYSGDEYNSVVDNIENEFLKFLLKL